MKHSAYILIAAALLLSGCNKTFVFSPCRQTPIQTGTEQDRYETLNPWDDISKTEDIVGVYINGQKTLSSPGHYDKLGRYFPDVSCKSKKEGLTIHCTISESAYGFGGMSIFVPSDLLELNTSVPAVVIRNLSSPKREVDTMSIASVVFEKVFKEERGTVVMGRFEFEGLSAGVEISGKDGVFHVIRCENDVYNCFH